MPSHIDSELRLIVRRIMIMIALRDTGGTQCLSCATWAVVGYFQYDSISGQQRILLRANLPESNSNLNSRRFQIRKQIVIAIQTNNIVLTDCKTLIT